MQDFGIFHNAFFRIGCQLTELDQERVGAGRILDWGLRYQPVRALDIGPAENDGLIGRVFRADKDLEIGNVQALDRGRA